MTLQYHPLSAVSSPLFRAITHPDGQYSILLKLKKVKILHPLCIVMMYFAGEQKKSPQKSECMEKGQLCLK